MGVAKCCFLEIGGGGVGREGTGKELGWKRVSLSSVQEEAPMPGRDRGTEVALGPEPREPKNRGPSNPVFCFF